VANQFTLDGGHQIEPNRGCWPDGVAVLPEFDKQIVDAVFNQRPISSKVGAIVVKSLNIILIQPGKRVFIATTKQIPKCFVVGADLSTRASHEKEGES